MNKIYLDFEARSFVDIFETGAYRYVMDPSTEITCCALAVDSRPVILFEKENLWQLKPFIQDPNNQFIAHNAFFEQCVCRKLFPELEINPKRWKCTAAKAAAASLPRSLEKVADALGLAIKKDVEGRRIMLRLAKPKLKKVFSFFSSEQESYELSFYEPSEEELTKLYEYCMTDVEVERLIDQAIPDLIPAEQDVWVLDQEINFRGVQLDMELVEAAIHVFGEYEAHLIEQIKEFTNGELDGATRISAMCDWIEKRIGKRPENLTKATVNALLDSDIPEDVRKLLMARRTLGKTSVKKFHAMKASVCADGRARDLYMYHGAGTGRWSGKMLQTQNLPRGSVKNVDDCIEVIKQRDWTMVDMLFDDVGAAVSSCIRGAIIAPPGKSLVVSDYASIEARVLLWCAGDEAGLEKYRRGVDLYCDMASVIYGRTITPKDKKERQLGKTAILGLGYGMGTSKFYQTCLSMGMEVTEELAELAVSKYRNIYSKVAKYWRDMEKAVLLTINSKQPTVCGRVKFLLKKDFLVMVLPSGRPITYYKSHISPLGKIEFMGVNATTKQFCYQSIWGGTIVENAVQAISRDLLVNGMINAENENFKVVMHVHDEIVAEVFDDQGYVNFDETISDLPKWGAGIPLEAEGFMSRRYRK